MVGSKKNKYGKCQLSVIPVRAAASHRAEMVTQLLYNENYIIIAEQEDWVKIKCQHDNYEGWLASNQVTAIAKEVYDTSFAGRQSQVILYKEDLQQYLLAGTPNRQIVEKFKKEKLLLVAQKFINVPYLWGGRSPLGIDCSGLVQVLFGIIGIKLPRDAYQQAQKGIKIDWQDRRAGDLVFFDNNKGKITHVGLLVADNELIHASGWVRQDVLTAGGIWHKTKKTHHLSHIQRIKFD